jgi:hypothetical protein
MSCIIFCFYFLNFNNLNLQSIQMLKAIAHLFNLLNTSFPLQILLRLLSKQISDIFLPHFEKLKKLSIVPNSKNNHADFFAALQLVLLLLKGTIFFHKIE